MLNEIIGDESESQDGGKMTKEAFTEEQKQELKQQEYIKNRAMLADQIGRSKHENYNEIFDLAMEVMKDKPRHYKSVADMLNDNNVDEGEIVEEILFIAQRNPKFKDAGKKASPEKQEEVSRAIKNSNKKQSSASLSSSGKGVMKSEDDLTLADAARMDPKQYLKLTKKTRDRLLQEAG